jgi:hypothetical protein
MANGVSTFGLLDARGGNTLNCCVYFGCFVYFDYVRIGSEAANA